MVRLLPLFRRSGVKAMFSGHEHNFQHSRFDGIDYSLKDGVKFFCGGTGSSVGAAMQQLAEKQNVIMNTYGMAAASMAWARDNPKVFASS
jgi:hypothetical protein